MKYTKLITAAIMALSFSTANAELAGMNDVQPVEESNNGLNAFIGVSGGNSMIAGDGTVFASLRIGLKLNSLFSSGFWASTTVSDVRNYNVHEKQLVNYKSFGAFVELFPFHAGKFSISIPLEIGGGVVNAMESGDDAFEPEDYFFTGDAALHFNYRLTKKLEVSIGGGYRMFLGIEENNLDNSDFSTPFGELRFTIKE